MSDHEHGLYTAARILSTSTRGTPTPSDLADINERFAVEPLEADDVFVFDLIASTDAVDTYFTHMDVDTSLRNFVNDFSEGQAILDSHVTLRLPIGSSFRAALEPIKSAEGAPASNQVRTTAYLQRALAEQYRTGILGGVYRKASVGFFGHDLRFVCDVDGKDLWDSDYYPGQRLKDNKRVTFTVMNAHAMELSLVFRNSTPGALVARVQDLVSRREIDPREVATLEQQWNTRFVLPSPMVRGIGRNRQGDRTMEIDIRALLEQVRQRAGKTISAATRSKLDAALGRITESTTNLEQAAAEIADLIGSVDSDAEEDRAVVAAIGENANVETVRTLRAEAEAGRAYRAQIINETVQARVAVAGDKFDAEAYRARLEKRDLADLEDEREAWSHQRATKFRPGRPVPPADLPTSEAHDRVSGGVYETVEE